MFLGPIIWVILAAGYMILLAALGWLSLLLPNRQRFMLACIFAASLVAPVGCTALLVPWNLTFNEATWVKPRVTNSFVVGYGLPWLVTFAAALWIARKRGLFKRDDNES
jgi:hypothetical protein